MNFISANKLFMKVLLVIILIKVASLFYLGYEYNILSDDASYVISGRVFAETFMVTMHGDISAQIMPGMTYFIGVLAMIFKVESTLWLVLKIVWLILGTLSIVGLYKIVRMYANEVIATICALFLIAPDFIWMDNVILTETPFMFCFIFLMYYYLRYFQDQTSRNFFGIVFFYFIGILIKPQIALTAIIFTLFLFIYKYDVKQTIKRISIAIMVTLVFIIPWSIRNYQQFGEFIPVTYGGGNPLLLGTYQGYGYPLDEELDYATNVDVPFREEYQYDESTPTHMQRFYGLKRDKIMADYRISEWISRDVKSFIISYGVIKPGHLVFTSFYWGEVFKIPASVNIAFRIVDLALFAASLILTFIVKRFRKETIFILSIYLSQLAIYSYTFSFSRYGQTLFFLRFIIIGFGLQIIYDLFKKKKKVV